MIWALAVAQADTASADILEAACDDDGDGGAVAADRLDDDESADVTAADGVEHAGDGHAHYSEVHARQVEHSDLGICKLEEADSAVACRIAKHLLLEKPPRSHSSETSVSAKINCY